jgi:hypothetical protein
VKQGGHGGVCVAGSRRRVVLVGEPQSGDDDGICVAAGINGSGEESWPALPKKMRSQIV